ncbi:Clavaminate synthase-like protein [Neolentinus lepideus HHB14362 ss-1]|uniref:Clavaminate synthase-like protein n=1 Tax=Neolentinus lepideus HHB14362 ss-1 TaxID=1314782 RepID=A0A165U420_9AGAM|nr:Clavaminate synthase-like protein [Neolentinus lepideus HHB14362 ss-1]
MPGLTLPPFPDDVPAHPLLVIDYALLKAGDVQEMNKLWKAATELGFWYLKNHGTDAEVSDMFDMGSDTMNLPLEEKMKFEQGDSGMSFGYKALGAMATDEHGTLDAVEFLNIAKDDVLSWPDPTHRTYPSTVEDKMESTIIPFVRKSLEINNLVLQTFNSKLGLPENTLLNLHSLKEPSGSEARCIKSPPKSRWLSEQKTAIGAHTDFGSLVLPPGSDQWYYIKPIPGLAVCNVGDALAIFSGGVLRSNLHRVVPPPGIQSALERWSLVFFTRPGNSSILEPLTDQSNIIAKAAATYLPVKHMGSTAGDWFARRMKNQRINNRTGPETWRDSRGTEFKPEAV